MPKFNMNWIYGMIIVALGVLFFTGGGGIGKNANMEASYADFKTYIYKGYASEVVINKDESTLKMFVNAKNIRDVFHATAKEVGNQPYITVQFGSVDQVENLLSAAQKARKFNGKLRYENQKGNEFINLLLGISPYIILILIYIFLMRRMSGGPGGGGGVFNVGKSRAKMYEKSDELGVTFKDVAGQAGAKQEVEEIVEFLKNPKKYTDLGGKIPKGALLVGPPGTGKTLLAKAVAGEANVPFFSMSGSDFVEMFVGVGASRVRDTFQKAKEKAPSIIFIDEIDAVGRARSKNPAMGTNDERENTLNALLTEMDGFGTNSGVIILAATNRVDMLDQALLRAGRFDRQIHVDLPDLTERKEIFMVHLKPVKVDKSLDIDLLARQTPGFSGADIANVCNEAALIAARHEKSVITKEDFMSAVDRIIGGLEKKNRIVTEEERLSIAIHEAGHATISWHLQYGNPLVKVTIVPRGKALGAAWYMPEERQITHTQVLLDEICSLLGGRAAEELFLGRISTGAANDLERVTRIAYAMVVYYGMSEKLPNINYHEQGGDYSFQKPYSDNTAEVIDQEVSRIIAEQYERAKQLLREKTEGHHRLYQQLLEREVIYTEDVEAIFGKRLWASRSDELLLAAKSSESPSEVSEGEKASEGGGEHPSEGEATDAVPPPFHP